MSRLYIRLSTMEPAGTMGNLGRQAFQTKAEQVVSAFMAARVTQAYPVHGKPVMRNLKALADLLQFLQIVSRRVKTGKAVQLFAVRR
jgi:hypothetical protein